MTDFTAELILLDGAMGTMLQAQGLMPEKIPEQLNVTRREAIVDIHRAYIKSGARILYTNTFGVNRYKLSDSDYTVSQLISAAVENAKDAIRAEGGGVLAALDCGPIGAMLRPNGNLSFEQAYEMFREIAVSGERAGADLLVFETFTDLLEMKAALLAAKENTSLPVFCTMTFEENGRTLTGASASCAAVTLESLGAAAVGINCSLGPEQILPLAQSMRRWTSLPLIVKANAGLPRPGDGKYDLSPERFASLTKDFLAAGVTILGGCCGTTPAYIAAIKQELSGATAAPFSYEEQTVLCSAGRAVVVDGVRIVGERINPTGKKLFREALQKNDMGYILNQALEQIDAGAHILDINVGTPEIDEVSMLAKTVAAVQDITDTPLQIDSSNPAAIEAALRIYNGKALVNSVNGEEAVLRRVLPLVKQYGAAVVGLTLDENGIPPTAEGRLSIAERIVTLAGEYGIKKSDVVIDCLTLTVSAQQKEAYETLRALALVKQTLGVKTTLGVSNISFGLPERELINTAFLTLALAHGLDLPIMNPNIRAMTGAVDAFNVLYHRDCDSRFYLERYTPHAGTPAAEKAQAAPKAEPSLFEAVEKGLAQAAVQAAARMLETTAPSEIIDGVLIPALDRVGEQFERGILFLPQLILAAAAAQECFELIKRKMSSGKDQTRAVKGRIILATVKGDVHDIGKNIVKVILENYGYEVIDLGKDVAIETVVRRAVEQNIKLVGLSALMTTTLKSMEQTIKALRERSDCKIMVGGAVLTESYAKTIGADYYAKDAKGAADIARLVFG